jgi:Na+/H+ antiporter NhaD/arsenite permease-like protein
LGASWLFILGVATLVIGPEFGLRPGLVGLAVGILALTMGREDLKEMLLEFDWNSLRFIMIPVCKNLAAAFGTTVWAFLYGMLIGTGVGGNITPVGATANVFACGVLEKNGHRVHLGEYLKTSIPFSVAAVATAHLLLQLLWM